MPFDPNAPTSANLKTPEKPARSRLFMSLRWRILTPLAGVLILALMVSAYFLAYRFVDTGDDTTKTQDELLAAGGAVAMNAVEVGRAQRTEVDRIAFTQGVREAIQAGDGAALQPLVEPLAALAGLDLVVISNTAGSEILGLQRVVVSGTVDYSVAEGTQLAGIPAVQSVLIGADSTSVLVSVQRRPMLVTAGPVLGADGVVVGVVMVGKDVGRVLTDLRGGNTADIALFSGDGDFVGTTQMGLSSIPLSQERYQAALNDPATTQFERLKLDSTAYEAAYFPFIIGQTPLGVAGVYQPVAAGSGLARGWMSLAFALVAGAFGVAGYALLSRPLRRLEALRATVDKLASGEDASTGMKPRDEIGEVGAAVDRYAAVVGVQERQQRREIAHLTAILDSLPDGVIVQDADGRVMTMNSMARRLLGAYGTAPEAVNLRQAAERLSLAGLESTLAPGLYAIGESTQIYLGNRVLRVEAAALQSVAAKRIGTVLTLRDMTQAMQQDSRRGALVDDLAQSVHVSKMARPQLEEATRQNPAARDTLTDLARELGGDTRSLGRLISDYRDLASLRRGEIQQKAAPLDVVDLLFTLAEEWRPAALAAGLSLEVGLPEDDELQILGDEKRLLWALGNLLDNAIKYSGGSGRVMVGVTSQPESSRLKLTVEDEGVGIAADDLPHVMSRFYRGKPTSPTGTRLEIVGTGQGLYFAHKIIEAHGGALGMASDLGKGTQISVWLPLTAGVTLQVSGASDLAESIWDQPTLTESKRH